jgi:hypothetical protein
VNASAQVPGRVRELAAEHQLGRLVRRFESPKRSNWTYPGAGRPARALYQYEFGLVVVSGDQAQAARFDNIERYWWEEGDGEDYSTYGNFRCRDGTHLRTDQFSDLQGREIEKVITGTYIPAMLAHFRAGGHVPFGPVSASMAGM